MATPSSNPPVRVVSGGNITNTMVYIGDVPLNNVVGVQWELDANHGSTVARLWLEMVGVDIELATDRDATEITKRYLPSEQQPDADIL